MFTLDFFRKFDTIIHIQLWKDRIRATKDNCDEVFEFEPIIAHKKNKNGKFIVFGHDALKYDNDDIQVEKPLSHTELAIDNYFAIELLLEHAIKGIMKKKLLIAPKVIIEPMEIHASILTMEAYRMLYEATLSAGAREVVVKHGGRIMRKEDFAS